MNYTISVISPMRRQGETTVASLLALSLSNAFETNVCLTHTGIDIEPMRKYFGLPLSFDYTKSISQLARLLDAGSISEKELGDYMLCPTEGLHILETAEPGNEGVSQELLERVFNRIDHKFTVVDMNTELSANITQFMLNRSDMVVVILSQDARVYSKLAKWQASGLFPQEHKTVYVVNNYDPIISALRDVSKDLGLRHTRVQKLNYNPYIKRMANRGLYHELIDYILAKDSRVVDLYFDLQEITCMIGNQLGEAVNWPGVAT